MGSIGSVYTAKELAQTFQSLLLCEFEMPDGSFLRFSTHALAAGYNTNPTAGSYQYGGVPWIPRILNQDIGATQAMSDIGVDIPPQVTVLLADPDKGVFSSEMAVGFKGSVLRIYSVMWDAGNLATGSFSSDFPAPIKFIGTCSAATAIDQKTIAVVATSLLNMTQQQIPPVRIQPLCPWSFPPNLAAQLDGLLNGDSPYYQCGYSASCVGGVGNFQSGTASFTSCDLSFAACVERLGKSSALIPIILDEDGRPTGRFGGFDYVPVQNNGLQRSYITGQWELIINATNEARYGDYIPVCYGTTWVQPEIMGVAGDANYTWFEAMLCFGRVYAIEQLIVNGDVVSWLSGGSNQSLGDNLRPNNSIIGISLAGGNGQDVKDNYWITVNNGNRNGLPDSAAYWGNKGDPYGSVAGINVQVLAQLATSSSLPQCQALIDAGFIRIYSTMTTYTYGPTRNPAWILMDMLIQMNWRYADLNIASFITAAQLCDQQIYFNRLDGAYANVYNETSAWPYLDAGVYNLVLSNVYNSYNPGDTVTGNISGATGFVTSWNSSTEVMEVSSIAGNFMIGERLLDSATGGNGKILQSSTSNAVPYRRYSVGFTVKQRTSIGEVIRGVRNAMRGMLYFDFNTGLLTLMNKQTIADQQPSPIIGSNYNTGVSSVHASGSPGYGYVAYSFDGSSILKNSSGGSTLKIVQSQYASTPNKVTNYFFDRENSYGQDISTIVDVEDVDRLGAEVSGNFNLVGVQTYDHMNRVTATWFAENYRGNPRLDYEGSAIGDTGGTIIFEFETSIKGLHLMVGQICLMTDAQSGITLQPFRITSIKPSQNFETAQIRGMWHNDNWYQDTFGQGAQQPIYKNPMSGPDTNPRPWLPNYEVPAAGDAYYGSTDLNFGVAQFYSIAADNSSVLAQLEISGEQPVNACPTLSLPPQLAIVGVGATGGGYPSGSSYLIGLSALAADGTISPMSNLAAAQLSPSQSAIEFVVQGWPQGATGYLAFVGTNSQELSLQATVTSATPALIDLTNTFQSASWGGPDLAFAGFEWFVYGELHAGVLGAGVVSVTSDSVTVSVYTGYGFGVNQFAGRELCVLGIQGTDPSNPVYTPIANFSIVSNTTNTFVLSAGNPTTCVYGGSLQPGDAVVVRILPTFGQDGTGYYFEDLQLVNALNQLEATYTVIGATNASPIVLAVQPQSGAFPFSPGQFVVVQGVHGNTNANGGFPITAVDSTGWTITLGGSVGNAAYTGYGTVNVQIQGLVVNEDAGNIAFIIAGTGQGTFAPIASNTATRWYISGNWPITPDSTSRIVVLAPTPAVDIFSSSVTNSKVGSNSTQAVNVLNFGRQTVLVMAGTVSSSGLPSLKVYNPFREIFLFGSQAKFPRTITASCSMLITDNVVRADATLGDIIYTCLPMSLVAGNIYSISNISTNSNTVTVNLLSGDTFLDGSSSVVLSQGESFTFQAAG